MRTIIMLVFVLFLTGTVQAQIGSSISADGTPPNTNAMLDVQSPATGDGKGILIPRVTQAQRTTASPSLAGGLLDGSGNLRGGAAQGLIVYQTDGTQGLYFNTSQSAAPAWAYLGDVAGLLASNAWVSADSTTNYLPKTGGTMSGPLDMGGQTVTNVGHIDFNGNNVSVGRGAYGSNNGAAIGFGANGSYTGVAVGVLANGYSYGAAVGASSTGRYYGAAMGYGANGYYYAAAMGFEAHGAVYGAAMGYKANGYFYSAAMGYKANAYNNSVAIGYEANGFNNSVAIGHDANAADLDAVAVGHSANATNHGMAVGYLANGANYGVAVGPRANGRYYGAATGYGANGYNQGIAVGRSANGSQTNVAIGMCANAKGGTECIAIGHNITNTENNTVRIRGNLYLDGGSSIYTNVGGVGSSDWGVKAFEIDHPLDPENKILRHFCLEGPQVWNVYAGNVQLVNGQAVVKLPDYYSALNLVGSEIYSLTPISSDLQVAVIKQEVINNRFVIGGSSDMKVSWTIKVLRNDPGCLEDLKMRPVEQLKSEIK